MWFHKKDRFPYREGLAQALLLVGYIALVATVFMGGERLFGNKPDAYWGPVVFLIMFVTSALISALIVFYKPYQLFMANKGKEAIQLVVATTKWLVVILGLIFTVVLLTQS